MLPIIKDVPGVRQWLPRRKIHQVEERIQGLRRCQRVLNGVKEMGQPEYDLEGKVKTYLLEERRLALKLSRAEKQATTKSTPPGSSTETQASLTLQETGVEQSSESLTSE